VDRKFNIIFHYLTIHCEDQKCNNHNNFNNYNYNHHNHDHNYNNYNHFYHDSIWDNKRAMGL